METGCVEIADLNLIKQLELAWAVRWRSIDLTGDRFPLVYWPIILCLFLACGLRSSSESGTADFYTTLFYSVKLATTVPTVAFTLGLNRTERQTQLDTSITQIWRSPGYHN